MAHRVPNRPRHHNHKHHNKKNHKSSTSSITSSSSSKPPPPVLNSCPIYPCPQPPPGASALLDTVCCSPFRGCGPLQDFTTCNLHNYNCENPNSRKLI